MYLTRFYGWYIYVTGALADGTVTTAKLAADAVTDAKLADDAVLSDINVTAANIAQLEHYRLLLQMMQ